MRSIQNETNMASNADSVGAELSPRVSRGEGSDKQTLASESYGIVLAGVHAWGGCVLDEVTYRPLLPVAGRPLICHGLGWLRGQGVHKASLCANSDTLGLRRYLGDGRSVGMSLEYYEDVMPRGPAGCVRDAGMDRGARYLVVVYGTIVPEVSLAEVLRAHVETGAMLTVVATPAGVGPSRAGRFLRPAGVYVFSVEALEYVPASGYQDIKEGLIPRLRAAGKLVATHVVGEALVGQVQDTRSYLMVNHWATLRACRAGAERVGYVRMGEGWVHESAKLGSQVSLIGPVIVEAGCEIQDGAVLVGPSTVGRECRIGPGALVSRSVVWSRCQIGAGAIVDHCVVTDEGAVEDLEVVRETVWMPSSRQRRNGKQLSRLAERPVGREHLAGYEPWSGERGLTFRHRVDERLSQHPAVVGVAGRSDAVVRSEGGPRW